MLSVGADANSVDNVGQTSVHVAVQGNHVACVETLLQNGALCDVRDVWHTTALQYAVSGQRSESVDVLKRYGADPSLLVSGLHVKFVFQIIMNCITVCVGT